jgi:hypothetical protein
MNFLIVGVVLILLSVVSGEIEKKKINEEQKDVTCEELWVVLGHRT